MSTENEKRILRIILDYCHMKRTELFSKCLCASLIDAQALGEAYKLDDSDTLVMLRIDNTVDCGIIIDKKVYEMLELVGLGKSSESG